MKAIGNYAASSSLQVGALFTFLLALGVCFVAYFLHLATNEVFLKESQVAVEAELDGLSRLYELHGSEAFNSALKAKTMSPKRDFFYAFLKNNELNQHSDFLAWPQLGYDAERGAIQINTNDYGQQFLASDVVDLMIKQATLSDASQLIVARDVQALDAAQWVARTFGWLMIITLVLISGLSLWVGYYVVNRINRIADTTERIIHEGALQERLPIDSSWDDLSQLSRALNRALDELALMVQGIQSISDNIAHDLRTPITRLRADIENISDEKQRTELLKEVDGIMAMFRGLLRIADVESNKKREAFKQNDVSEILLDVIELYHPIADTKDIVINQLINPVTLYCDRDLLFQALANVLDNAIKFTPHNGSITLTLNSEQRTVNVNICDSGPGIPSEFIDKVTQRFFRIDKSRHSAGHGLGLAMVNAVVKLHRGQMIFSQNPHGNQLQGLCCRMEFPVNEP